MVVGKDKSEGIPQWHGSSTSRQSLFARSRPSKQTQGLGSMQNPSGVHARVIYTCGLDLKARRMKWASYFRFGNRAGVMVLFSSSFFLGIVSAKLSSCFDVFILVLCRPFLLFIFFVVCFPQSNLPLFYCRLSTISPSCRLRPPAVPRNSGLKESSDTSGTKHISVLMHAFKCKFFTAA